MRQTDIMRLLKSKGAPYLRGAKPGLGGASLIAALLAAKPELEGKLQDYLGLNEQEQWINPQGSSYETAPMPMNLPNIPHKKMY